MMAGLQLAMGAIKGKEMDPRVIRERPDEDLEKRDRTFLPGRRLYPRTEERKDSDGEEKKRENRRQYQERTILRRTPR